MALISLVNGSVATIDDDLFDALSRWRWRWQPHGRTGYAFRNTRVGGVSQTVWMHRVIMDAPPDLFVDHVDHDGLNNRRGNLRLVTPAQNQWNRLPGTEGAGVCWSATANKWRAYIDHKGKKIEVGFFDDRGLAEKARQYMEARLRDMWPVPEFDTLLLSPSAKRLVGRR